MARNTATAPAKKEVEVVLLPEGRLINHALFEKDRYDDKSTPKYKVELAFPKGELLDPIFEKLFNRACDDFGENCGQLTQDGGNIISGVLDGEVLKRKREAKGKEGDAYADMWVIRADTIYNLNGQDAPGGIQVFAPDTSPIGIANQGEIYPGCYGHAAVTIDTYTDEKTGHPALKFYLSAFQKTRDGEKLIASKDHSTLFKPVGRPANTDGASAAGGGRARRKG